jgi:hypothetical protein
VFHVISAKGGPPCLSVLAVLDVQWAAVRNGLLAQVEARQRELVLAAAPSIAQTRSGTSSIYTFRKVRTIKGCLEGLAIMRPRV